MNLVTNSVTTTPTSITKTFTLKGFLDGDRDGTCTYIVGKLGSGTELHLLSNGTVPACRNRSRRVHSAGRRTISEVTCLGCIEHRDQMLAEQAALGA